MDQQRHQMEVLIQALTDKQKPVTNTKFTEFDPTSELWSDYWSRFRTFCKANAIEGQRTAEIFLTNQSGHIYKLLKNLASQQSPPRDVNDLSMDEICTQMEDQFNPKRFIVRERFKFWTQTERRPGETAQDLASRIRQEAATCDFQSITDPLDEAMRTRFVCSINNEAVIKALFKIKEDELTFARAIEIATEVEEASRVTKETLGRPTSTSLDVNQLQQKSTQPWQARRTQQSERTQQSGRAQQSGRPQQRDWTQRQTQKPATANSHTSTTCSRCSGLHSPYTCRFKEAKCRYCQKTGHIERACRKKKREVKRVEEVNRVRTSEPLHQLCTLRGTTVKFEVDTGTRDSFISVETWNKLKKPTLSPTTTIYSGAGKQNLPVIGVINIPTTPNTVYQDECRPVNQQFVVTKLDLHLLGRTAIQELGLSVDKMMQQTTVKKLRTSDQPLSSLQQACRQLCDEFPDVFKEELGTLKDVELEVKFKTDATPVFHRPRPVPIALQEELDAALQAGIQKGVWEPTQFNAYGTPIVPIQKTQEDGKIKLRVCGDYSGTINPQLEPHRHPMPLPEDLMRKLGRGHGFTKIDLADAYNQVCLGPESQRRLALSTHRGVLLQKRLPFGIISAPGYFQEIMDQLTQDLPGVAAYIDDILVSGDNAEQHLENLRRLLQRLQDRGLRCNLKKCKFAQEEVEYLGHTLSRGGVKKGPKVNAVTGMPAPTNVPTLRSFLGQVQFYNKFLPNLATVLEPLYNLTKKGTPWKWGDDEQRAFKEAKQMLSADTVLAHFDPSLEVGISCDASDVGVGAVLFHRYQDGSERPIANVSKTLTPTQRRYSQIQKEAMAIIFALKKFHQFLFGRKFTLVTDHKPLVALFGPTKPIPALAANRLARWAFTLSQYDYKIEYRKTSNHGNADALSRLPAGADAVFDREESNADTTLVCTINMINQQIAPPNANALKKETEKDPVLIEVSKATKKGWPLVMSKSEAIQPFARVKDDITWANGCLFYGSRVIVPQSLQPDILKILHLGHFGKERMKQLARTAVYWPGIDKDIINITRNCVSCNEHQRQQPTTTHPWSLPDKPWSRVHIDHAVNFKGHQWLVVVDAYSKYPCIHQMSAITTKATIRRLEEDFAHFGYPHTLVTDNAQCFLSAEFQQWCRQHGIENVRGAPYHPQTNGAAERLVQSFKQSLQKSSLPPTEALQEFLMLYRRTPLNTGLSPSQLLNGRQLRAQLDVLIPGPEEQRQTTQGAPPTKFTVDDLCYALSFKAGKKDKWMPATIISPIGRRMFSIKFTNGQFARRHVDQLRPRH